MGDDRSGGTVMDLDLNQEPLDPPVSSVLGLGFLLNELETAHGRIEERIRQLEAVTARARQRQRWRQSQNDPETSNLLVESLVDRSAENEVRSMEHSIVTPERIAERGKSCKRDSSHLVAKALGMDPEVRRVNKNAGGFFDCNKCLNIAKDPVITCCGHLFCWSCFYGLPYVDSTAKECTVCKGEVTDTSITPIYGNGNNTPLSRSESESKVPPRPRAHRVESLRQQQINHGFSHIPVAETRRRIRTSIGTMAEHPRRQDPHNASASSNIVLENAETGGSQRLRPHQFTRVLSESAASLSSISSALNSAERLVENLETYLNDHFLRDNAHLLAVHDENPSNSSTAVVQSENSTAQMSSTMPIPSPSGTVATSTLVIGSRNLDIDTTTDVNPTVAPASSRRTGVSRVFDVQSVVSRAVRRRRLS